MTDNLSDQHHIEAIRASCTEAPQSAEAVPNLSAADQAVADAAALARLRECAKGCYDTRAQRQDVVVEAILRHYGVEAIARKKALMSGVDVPWIECQDFMVVKFINVVLTNSVTFAADRTVKDFLGLLAHEWLVKVSKKRDRQKRENVALDDERAIAAGVIRMDSQDERYDRMMSAINRLKGGHKRAIGFKLAWERLFAAGEVATEYPEQKDLDADKELNKGRRSLISRGAYFQACHEALEKLIEMLNPGEKP